MIDEFFFVWYYENGNFGSQKISAASLKEAKENFLQRYVDSRREYDIKIVNAYIKINYQLIDIIEDVKYRHANKICILAEKLYKKTLRGENTSSEEKDMFDYLNGRR